MLNRVCRALSAGALALAASACGSDSSVAPNDHGADLNQIFAELWTSGLTASVSTPRGVLSSFTVPAFVPSNCSYAAASKSFECPTQSLSGLSITQSYTLLDVNGAPQSAFDPATTASVHTNSSVKGALAIGTSHAAMDAQDSRTLSGLLTGVHTLNGTSTSKLSETSADSAGAQPYTSTTTSTIENLVLPDAASGNAHQWPVSGTITTESTSTLPELPDLPGFKTRTVMTFNGTSTVSITMDDGFSIEHCTMDLATGTVACT